MEGTALLYADRITNSMNVAMRETERRRGIQAAHNEKHGISPKPVVRSGPGSELMLDLLDEAKRRREEEARIEKGVVEPVDIPGGGSGRRTLYEQPGASAPPVWILETEMLEPAGGKQMQMGGGVAGLDLMRCGGRGGVWRVIKACAVEREREPQDRRLCAFVVLFSPGAHCEVAHCSCVTASSPRAHRPGARPMESTLQGVDVSAIPVTIVTGFLGAGKTTLLRHVRIAARAQNCRDSKRPSGRCPEALHNGWSGRRALREMAELANGCVCCEVRDERLPRASRRSWPRRAPSIMCSPRRRHG